MKHTPAPWKVTNHTKIDCGTDITFTGHNGASNNLDAVQSQLEANAHLIAAAPLMLAALELIQNDNRLMNALNIEQRTAVMDAIRSAGGAE